MNRKTFFNLLRHRLSESELAQIQAAYWISKEAHRTQLRDSGERYFEHPRRAAQILIEHDIISAHAIILALLHDTLEDTPLPASIIAKQFGDKTLHDVLLLSKRYAIFDTGTGRITRWEEKEEADYYAAIATAEPAIRAAKTADRIDNLRSMTKGWSKEKQKWYRSDTKRYILPIAEETDTGLTNELKKLIDEPA